MPTLHFRRIERRRTARVALFVDVIVEGLSQENEKFKVRTRTQSVSGHGGSMMLDTQVAMGQLLLLTNEFSGDQTECKVVALRESRDGRRTVAFEFAGPHVNFWKMCFPAAGTKPVRRMVPAEATA
jgi:c-di-GMP-binding flagellar brake protein YcgR